MVHLVPVLPSEPNQAPPIRRRPSRAIVRSGPCGDRAASRGGGLQIEEPGVVVVLALAGMNTRYVFVAVEGESVRVAAGSAMREGRGAAARKGDAHGVETGSPTEREARTCRGHALEGGQVSEVAEPRAVRPTGEVGLAEARRKGPRELDEDRVVVAERGAVAREELRGIVRERRRVEAQERGAAEEHLVDRLAGVVRRGVGAHFPDGGYLPAALELEPCVSESVLGVEDVDVVCGARISAVGVSEDEDGVADGPDVDVVGYLLYVRRARLLISVLNTEKRGSAVIPRIQGGCDVPRVRV